MSSISKLRIPADLTNLAAVRQFVEQAALDAGLSMMAAADITLAVDEAVTNVIVHGYPKNQGEIEVQAEHLPNGVKIRIIDQAPIFNPCTRPLPDIHLPLEMRKPGGLGIYLICQVVDEISHQARSQGGNELVLVKYSDAE